MPARPGRWTRLALVLSSVLVLVVVWALAARGESAVVLPSPHEVLQAFRDQIDRGVWWPAVRATLEHVALAFVLIVSLGLPLGVLMGRVRAADGLLRFPLILLQTVPTVVLAAVALISIGTNATAVVAVTAASGLPFFTLNVIEGTRAVDPGLLAMATAYGASEMTIVRSVVVPSLVPFVLAGARIALGVAWHVTLLCEYLMGTPSVGYAISTDIRFLDTPAVVAWGLTIVALSLLLEYGVFRPVQAALGRRMGRAPR